MNVECKAQVLMEKITSRHNSLYMHMKKLGTSKSYRDEKGEFLFDGLKLLEEAVNSDAEVTTVLTASPIPFPLSIDTRVYNADRGLLDSLSQLKNSHDTLAICKMPDRTVLSDTSGTHILLDGVQDPGNVGTIIRTADALGINSVILTRGCADMYNPKTIRATMGAVFRQKVCHMSMHSLTVLRESGVRFIGAVIGEKSIDVIKADLSNAVIAVGNEGQGLSDDLISLCQEMVMIPVASECESLNVSVAAAIMMWEAKRVRSSTICHR